MIMKRQLGMVLAVLALFFVPLAWAQSDSTDSSSSSGSSTSDSSASSVVSTPGITAGGFTDPSFQTGQTGSSDSSQSDSGDSSQTSPDGMQTNPDGTQTTTGPQSTFSHPEQLPPLSMINDVTSNSGVALIMNVGTLNDYVFGGKGQPNYWENMLMTNGGISYSQLREHSLVQLGYTGGVSLTGLTFGPSSTFTTLNQTGNARILWNFSRRWQLRVKENYLYSDDPFAPFQEYVGNPTPNQPIPTVFFPNAVIEQNQATADIAYRLSDHDSLDFQGSESLLHYIRGASGLWNSYTWGGGAFYQHTFSQKLSAGGGYNFNALDFGHGQSRAGVQMFEGFISYKFNSAFSVSGWIGPELTATKDLVTLTCIPPFGCLIEEVHRKQWNVAEGGTLAYMRHGNSIRMQFSHSVSNGGGLLGAVGLYTATIAYTRPLNRLWGFSAAAMYDNSKSISHQVGQYWNAAQGLVNLTRKIGDSWNSSVYLLFIHQSQNFYGTPGTNSAAGVGLTVRYIWGHSLGR
jgi:hypothetical protein